MTQPIAGERLIEKRRAIMGDKGKKDKNKHDKQVNAAKNAQNEANRKKQEKTH